MEGIGIVRPSLARDFGLVGPAARACGIDYDVRKAFPTEPYAQFSWELASASDGDVYARALIRVQETRASLELIRRMLDEPADWKNVRVVLPDALRPNAIGVGIVEAWRGELIHLGCTDGRGNLARYSIKDPSVNNWTGLAIAARGALVADFPLCNKSFGLSYSGNDL
jgi:Ni,Fe-hydrogenase III large subunit